MVLSGADSGTHWSIDGRGNYWSRYRGFDFDGDGVGDAAHPVVGAFERLEGNNPAARIFLQSPAAAGLELAARLSGHVASDAVDTRPIVSGGSAANQRVCAGRSGWVRRYRSGGLLLTLAAIAAVAFKRGAVPCLH